MHDSHHATPSTAIVIRAALHQLLETIVDKNPALSKPVTVRHVYSDAFKFYNSNADFKLRPALLKPVSLVQYAKPFKIGIYDTEFKLKPMLLKSIPFYMFQGLLKLILIMSILNCNRHY